MISGIVSAKKQDRVLQRAKSYALKGAHVFQVWADDRLQVVLHLAQRAHIVQHVHEKLGHFELERTYNLLLG